MASISYPSSLPRAQIRYSFDAASNKFESPRTEAEIQRRRRSETIVRGVAVEWTFDENDIDAFRTWFDTTLRLGTALFNIELAFGDGVKSNEAKFMDRRYNMRILASDEWSVTANLEVKDAVVINTTQGFFDVHSSIGQVGNVMAMVIPLSLSIIESFSYIVKSEAVVALSTAVLESDTFTNISSSNIDLSTAILESGNT